jgi:hypothetical protein
MVFPRARDPCKPSLLARIMGTDADTLIDGIRCRAGWLYLGSLVDELDTQVGRLNR